MLRVVRVPDVLEGRRPGAALADGMHLAGRECHAWHMSQAVAGGARGLHATRGTYVPGRVARAGFCHAWHVRRAAGGARGFCSHVWHVALMSQAGGR